MKMMDISEKDTTMREAIVEGRVYTSTPVILAIKENKVPKGDVLKSAELAGILAAKNTAHLIPLCHPIPIEYINIEFSLGKSEITIRTTVKGRAKTGVEMEALSATAISALTIYDMCKSLDRDIVISDIKLIEKKGGKSGEYIRRTK